MHFDNMFLLFLRMKSNMLRLDLNQLFNPFLLLKMQLMYEHHITVFVLSKYNFIYELFNIFLCCLIHYFFLCFLSYCTVIWKMGSKTAMKILRIINYSKKMKETKLGKVIFFLVSRVSYLFQELFVRYTLEWVQQPQ